MTIENVRVTEFDSRFSLSWEQPGARYHAWCGSDHKPGEDIYKNPPVGIMDRRDPGYFDTRRLSAKAAANAPMLAEAMQIADRDGLWQKAIDAKQAEELSDRIDRVRREMNAVRQGAGPALHKALAELVQAVERQLSRIPPEIDPQLAAARDALASATPDEAELSRWRDVYGAKAVELATKDAAFIVREGVAHEVKP